MKKTVALLLVISFVLSLTSCSKITGIFSRGNEQSFSYPIAEMPHTLDPQIATEPAELIVIENCMEGLVRLNENGEVIPAVADSWDISADGLTYTFHLNANAHWAVDTDGKDFELKNFNKAITAHDFVFAFSRAALSETGAPDFQSISLIKNALKINRSGTADASALGVEALDDYTFEVELEHPNSDFLKSLTNAVFMPCSEQFFEYCAGRYGKQTKYFLSNAGFELRTWNESNLVLRKNKEYTLANAAIGDSVTLYKDENAFENFKNNNYDAIAVDFDAVDEALADPSLCVQQHDDTVWVLGFNCAGTLGGYRQLRQALVLGFDTEGLAHPEWATAATSAVPNICTANGLNYAAEIARSPSVSYTPQTAKEKYEAFVKKYEQEHDDEQIPTLKLLCTAPFEKCAKLITQNWQMNFGTGFEVKISVVTLPELRQAMEKGEFDAAITPLDADTADSLVFLKQFAADNVFRYESEAYQKEIASADDQAQKCLECENILLTEAALYPLFDSNSYYVQRNTVSGIYFYAFGGKVNFLNAQRSK